MGSRAVKNLPERAVKPPAAPMHFHNSPLLDEQTAPTRVALSDQTARIFNIIRQKPYREKIPQ
jgi:hypothetical protein